ncbi:MAG: exonuclease domain-containing protein [Burkholderiales bacterium]|nr:exonuclease domain-containing protein [Burkholderiales bacterium]
MLPPRLAIIDLETTGTDPTRDRVTEVAILIVDDGVLVEEWSSLVNPGVPIPPEIQALTGIRDDMVRSAPTFAELADEVMSRLHDRVFVAHNARFDYGFIKNECRRLGLKYAADVLCTVRLSRRIDSEYSQHGLDAIIERHQLSAEGRHRALGDARMAWLFLNKMAREHDEDIEHHIKSLLRMPSLPPQLPQDALAALPEGPGVYVFFGVNDLPLYIGKSVQLKDRVRSHFSSDHMSANDARLALEIRRIEFEETAGELGALIREAQWIKSATPLTNRALRRNDDAVFVRIDEPGRPPVRVPVNDIDWSAPAEGLYGPFSSKARVKAVLEELAAEQFLCWQLLGIQRGAKPGQACFARQLKRCPGGCEGIESPADHQARLAAALDALRFPDWPFPGPALIAEEHPERDWTAWHLVDRWCHRGVVRHPDAEGALALLCAAPTRPVFDVDVYKLLWRHWTRHPEAFRPVAGHPATGEAIPGGHVGAVCAMP